MVLVMYNQDKDFYSYMGKIFGSRVIEKQTNDRFYDDSEKEWYINVKNDKVVACVSLKNKNIKNIYTSKKEYLQEILVKIKKDTEISPSTVTNLYKNVYLKSGYKVIENERYKNFVVIN